MKTNLLRGLAISLVVMIASLYNVAKAQVDTTTVAKPDTVLQEKSKKEKKEDDKKRKDEFIPYVGVNFNMLGTSSDENYESSVGIGYHLKLYPITGGHISCKLGQKNCLFGILSAGGIGHQQNIFRNIL